MSRLLLIRHAPTPETGRRLTGRAPGVGLDQDGAAIAAQLATSLARHRLAAVHTSPILRCRETAAAIAGPQGLTPMVNDALTEIDFGRWTGRTLAQLRRTRLWTEVAERPSRVRFPEGESLREAQLRAVEACEGIALEARTATVGVVTHADIIKLILSHYLGQPLDLFQRIAVMPASVSVVSLGERSAPMVEAVNNPGASE